MGDHVEAPLRVMTPSNASLPVNDDASSLSRRWTPKSSLPNRLDRPQRSRTEHESRHIPAVGEPLTKVKRLILAPHCDDETMGCGGLLAKYPEECVVVVAAVPEDVRAKEFFAAQQILGYQNDRFLNFPDGSLNADMYGLVSALDAAVAEFEPEELYIPFPSSHQDHIACYEAGVRAARLSMTPGHWFTPSIFAYDVAAYDLHLYPTHLKWNVFESLTENQADKKVAALAAYQSQQVNGPHPSNFMKGSAAACGAVRRVNFAEPFALVREVRN